MPYKMIKIWIPGYYMYKKVWLPEENQECKKNEMNNRNMMEDASGFDSKESLKEGSDKTLSPDSDCKKDEPICKNCDDECDCHIMVGGSGKPCPQCECKKDEPKQQEGMSALGIKASDYIEDEIKQELQKDYDVVPRTSEVKG